MLSVWQWLFILMLAFSVQSASAQTTWSLGYDTPFGTMEFPAGYVDTSTLDWSALTHLGFLGGAPNSNGTTTLSANFSTTVPGVITAAHGHGVKVLYMLSNLGSGTDFNGAITNHESMFIANIMSTVNTYGFDGVIEDNEEAWNSTLMTTFLSDLRTALGSRILVGTTNTSQFDLAGCLSTNGGWDAPHAAYLDRLEMEVYDVGGTWNAATWFGSPLFSPNGGYEWSYQAAFQAMVACGIPAAKILIGLPFFGDLWTPNTGPHQSWGASPAFTEISYSNIVANYSISGATYDTTAHEPWIAVTEGWLSWDNVQSLTEKVNWVKANGLGGWVMWWLGADYVSSSTPTNPLLDAVKQAFRPAPPTDLRITVN